MTPAASANIAAPEGRRPTPVRGVPAPVSAQHGAALPARAGWPERIAVAAIVLFAVALRAHGLSTFPLEQDELYTVDEGTFLLHSELRPGIAARPLYYLLVHPMLMGLPQTPVLLRLLPFLFGIGGVIAAWWLARRTLGRTAGLAAATFVAISPWHLYASGMARYWSLVFLFAALSYALIPRAINRDDRRAYVPAFVVLLLGSVTHPSFLFPMSGAILGAHLIHADGRLGLRWPTATAWRWLWGPYAVALAAGALVVRSLTHASGLTNWNGRGAAADLRLIPAVVEWATPVMFAAALACIVLLFRERSPVRRRWALMAGLGIVASLVALIASSTKTNTYADYAMAALPLVLVTAAALPQLIRGADRNGGWRAPALAGVVVAPGRRRQCRADRGCAAGDGVPSHRRYALRLSAGLSPHHGRGAGGAGGHRSHSGRPSTMARACVWRIFRLIPPPSPRRSARSAPCGSSLRRSGMAWSAMTAARCRRGCWRGATSSW